MNINSFVRREVISASQSESIKNILDLMSKNHVGSVVLTNGNGNNRNPVGIITDRDIALKVTLQGKSPDSTPAKEVMSGNLLKIGDYAELDEVIDLMSKKAVRRAPIVDKDNNLVGIISLDLLTEAAGNFLSKLCRIIQKQSKA